MMKLGAPIKENMNNFLGKRDAFHVQAVAVRWAGVGPGGVGFAMPGGSVRFTDNNFNEVVSCDAKVRHAVIDPFANAVEIQGNVLFLVFMQPGMTSDPIHHFEMKINDLNEGNDNLDEDDDEDDEDDDEYDDEENDDDDYDDGCRNC
jgi:hypothetical protein